MIDFDKYLLPYEDCSKIYGFPIFERHKVFGKRIFYPPSVWLESKSRDMNKQWRSTREPDFRLTSPIVFSSKESAMNGLDNYLVSLGYYIIREDEVERFTKKLSLLL